MTNIMCGCFIGGYAANTGFLNNKRLEGCHINNCCVWRNNRKAFFWGKSFRTDTVIYKSRFNVKYQISKINTLLVITLTWKTFFRTVGVYIEERFLFLITNYSQPFVSFSRTVGA